MHSRHRNLSRAIRWANDRDRSAILHPCLFLPSPALLWLNAPRGKVNQNSIKHQNQGFYGAGAQSSSHPMCLCICTAQHKVSQGETPFYRSAFHTHNQTAASNAEHPIEQCSHTPVGSGVPWTPSGSCIFTYYVNQENQKVSLSCKFHSAKINITSPELLTWGDEGIL